MTKSTQETSLGVHTILTTTKDWPEWYHELRWHAVAQNVWSKLDPAGPGPGKLLSELEAPIYSDLVKEAEQIAEEEYQARHQVWEEHPQGPRPQKIPINRDEVRSDYDRLAESYRNHEKERSRYATSFNIIQAWISRSVDTKLIQSIMIEQGASGNISLYDMIKDLRNMLAPNEASIILQIRNQYRSTLEQARKGNVKPRTWHANWITIYQKAKSYKISEVEGTQAIQDFLRAISEKMMPQWGAMQIAELIKASNKGLPIQSLIEYSRDFGGMISENEQRETTNSPGMFATLGERSDQERAPPQGRSQDSQQTRFPCPCKKKGERYHKWPPERCGILEFALTGTNTLRERGVTLDQKEIEAIKGRLTHASYKDLRNRLTQKGWISPRAKTQSDSLTHDLTQNVQAALMDPQLIEPQNPSFSTMNLTKHPLYDSTLVDNCGATHLVNSRARLVEGSFVPATNGEVVEAGTTSFPIDGKGIRIMEKIFPDEHGNNTRDLELSEVVLVEGFHTNIVSAARLRKAKVWYGGFDCSLRTGPYESSILLKKLEERHNLTFLEYKPLSSYSDTILDNGIMAVIKRPPTGAPIVYNDHSRRDTEHLWHLRSGHLGFDALQKLMLHARNVWIGGTSKHKCEFCAQATAARVISRNPTERASRPFHKLVWDLFDYVRGYTGAEWLLVIKDDYSGKLFSFPLVEKSLVLILEVFDSLLTYIKTQYNLDIRVLKHDNERAVIPINGISQYQKWAEAKGIRLELSPPYTHEPNGGSERAGQEVIVRALKMALAANLPKDLWPETTSAATYLFNMGPLRSQDYRSPNEVLESWFTQHFRYYEPLLVRDRTADLRPDWSGVYAYGCRAYPLHKDRAAEREKRAFKVRPRAHIGYLVGYCASNIYRIWVPKLDEVIITRDVTFDEELFFEGNDKELPITAERLATLEPLEFIQDAGFIPDTLREWSDRAIQQRTELQNNTEELGGGSTSESQNSGVDTTEREPEMERASAQRGLLTPDRTPEPSGILAEGDGSSQEKAQDQLNQDMPESTDRAGEARSPALHEQQEEVRDTIVVATDPPIEPPQDPDPETSREPEQQTAHPPAQRPTADRPSQNRGARRSRTINAEPLRSSRRIRDRNLDPTGYKPSRGGMYATLIYSKDQIEIQQNRTLGLIFSTYLPCEEALQEGDRAHRKMHAAISAATKWRPSKRASEQPPTKIEQLTNEPRNWHELQKHPHGKEFKEAAHEEVKAMIKQGVFKVLDRERATNRPIPLKWVFKYKFDENNQIERYKARLCVRGDLQSINTLQSTYAATLAARSFRTMMAIVAQFDLELEQFDVSNAFLNAERGDHMDPVYCELPPGFEQSNKVVLLQRALYGLRDSPLLWYREFATTLKRLELIPSKEEPCLFYDEQRKAFVVFFVDDFLVIYHRDDHKRGQAIIAGITQAYEIKKQEHGYYLGMRITRKRSTKQVWLTHDTYIEKIAKRYGLDYDQRPPTTPLPLEEILPFEGAATPKDIKRFQERIGSILYTAIMIRPDVAFAAALLSRHLINPGPQHHEAADRVIRYLYVTRYLSICYGNRGEDPELQIASDTSFGDDPQTRRSSQGYIVKLFGGLIAWRAARQDTVTTSTTEAELLGLAHTTKESIAIERLFKDLQLDLAEALKIGCDNQQTIRLVIGNQDRITTKLRHVDIHNMWLKQEHSKGSFQIEYVPTAEMPADGLTKNLPRLKFDHFRKLLNLQDAREIINCEARI